MSILKHLENLSQLMGVSGDEAEVRDYLKSQYETLCDEIVYDNLGSIVGIKKSRNPEAKTVLVLGHMDEVGFVVKGMNEKGQLSLAPLGGWWSQTLLAHRVTLKNRYGKKFKGAIGSIPPHLLTAADRAKPLEIKDMLVDLGFTSLDELKAEKIQVGDTLVLDGPYEKLSDKRVLGKAFDNRYGCALGLALLEAVKDKVLDFNLAVGASVQEEVGLRGAQTITYALKPDLAIVLDCSPANDASGAKDAFGQLGNGPLVRFIDTSYLPHRGFLEFYVDVMDKAEIPYQYYQSMGGTDAGIVHKSLDGIPTLTLCICARNIHTNSSILDTDDLSNALKASLSLCEALNSDTIMSIRKSNQ